MPGSLGSQLKKIREEKGIDLEDAARALRMKSDRLHEIEEDEYGNFPSLAYARSFVLNYGKYLGVDVKPHLCDLELADPIGRHDFPMVAAAPAPSYRPFQRSGEKVQRRPPVFAMMILLIVLLAGGAGFYFYTQVQRLGLINDQAVASEMIGEEEVEVDLEEEPAIPPAPGAQSVPDAIDAPVVVEAMPEPLWNAPDAGEQTVADPADPVSLELPNTTSTKPESLFGPATSLPGESIVPLAPEPQVGEGGEPSGRSDFQTADSTDSSVLVMHPLKKTWVKVVIDEQMANPSYQDWISPDEKPIQLTGNRFFVEVQDPEAVHLFKDGEWISLTTTQLVID